MKANIPGKMSQKYFTVNAKRRKEIDYCQSQHTKEI